MSADDARPSPAEGFARMRRKQRHPLLAGFEDLYDFTLDDFQLRACRDLEDGLGVLVAAPTGSGKTLVGEFAVHLALELGRKCFYTTPIKALSNQKYNDLAARYGAERVGLLTGDNSINGEADVVVMTTEVLRNMLYAGSNTLDRLGYVVMDEVHYLADRDRGAVWEEVIIHLPESVSVVSLSATVSNAEEFGEWLETVRGETSTIVEERRPVPLFQHVMVGKRIHDLFDHRRANEVNPDLLKVARDEWASIRIRDRRNPRGRSRAASRGQSDRASASRRNVGNGRRVWVPSRPEMVERLDRSSLLPAIVFIFSRAGCDAAVQQCLRSPLRLTSDAEREEIVAYVQSQCADLPAEDLQVLGYHDFVEGLSRGVAAHHAGMLPTFKETVEELFLRGLCKVVFATETLALGINMPARSVVIEKMSKWNGETHADITPGEYTQLTGRAGRRGLDVEGHSVVLWQQGFDPKSVAGLASTRTYPLQSSFRPSYNMAVNLVRQFGRTQARQLLEQSFAQFQADKAVVGLARQLAKSEEALAGYAGSAACDRGDFMEYAALRRQLSEVESKAARRRKQDRRDAAEQSLLRLRPGDVIKVPSGKYSGFAVVLDPGTRSADAIRPQVITAGRHSRRLSTADFPTPVAVWTRIKVPKNFNHRDARQRRELADLLVNRTRDLRPPPEPGPDAAGGDVGTTASGTSDTPTSVDGIRRKLRSHPCHQCPDREDHARWAERWSKLDRDAATLRQRITQRTSSIARRFDKICEVLDRLEYLDGDQVTAKGERLMRIYAELDLVASEALIHQIWDDLDPSELAAVLSTLVFESRRPDEAAAPRIPGASGGLVAQAVAATVRLTGELDDLQREHRLEFTRQPDLGFVWAAYRWAEGDELDDVLDATGLAAGDFVRWIKQLIDLTAQIAGAGGSDPLRDTARRAVQALRRGVVAYSSVAE